MNKSVHFIIEPQSDTQLPKIMQWILGVFAVRYNKRFSLRGHVWYDRYKSEIIKGMLHYLQLFLSVTLLPVIMGVAERPELYGYVGWNGSACKYPDIVQFPELLTY